MVSAPSTNSSPPKSTRTWAPVCALWLLAVSASLLLTTTPRSPAEAHSPLYQCFEDGSVSRDGAVPISTTAPCLWGEQGTTRLPMNDSSTSCPGSELLAALEGGSLSREAIEVVVVRHDEDISWSDEFARVRTVYTKRGPELSIVSPTVASSAVAPAPRGAATSPRDGLEVVLPNVGREQHAYLTHIVRNYDRLADWTVFLHGKLPTCGFFLLDAHKMGNHLVRDPRSLTPPHRISPLTPLNPSPPQPPHSPHPPTPSPPSPTPRPPPFPSPLTTR